VGDRVEVRVGISIPKKQKKAKFREEELDVFLHPVGVGKEKKATGTTMSSSHRGRLSTDQEKRDQGSGLVKILVGYSELEKKETDRRTAYDWFGMLLRQGGQIVRTFKKAEKWGGVKKRRDLGKAV